MLSADLSVSGLSGERTESITPSNVKFGNRGWVSSFTAGLAGFEISVEALCRPSVSEFARSLPLNTGAAFSDICISLAGDASTKGSTFPKSSEPVPPSVLVGLSADSD